MSDAEFVSFVESLDQCWLQDRLQDMSGFLAHDVVLVAPGGKLRSEGIAPAVESYRQFLTLARIHHFQASQYFVTQRGDTVVVEYGWQMNWTMAGAEHSETGRDILVLARREDKWRVIWRTQIPGSS